MRSWRASTSRRPACRREIAEFDRVTGGGLVPGSALLVGGDPGIGKSTILLQVAANLAARGARALYISGEEAADQVRLRAQRLGLAQSPVAPRRRDVAPRHSRNAEGGEGAAHRHPRFDPDPVSDTLEAAPGTVSQVRACAAELVRFGKERGATIILVGHVTKDGQIAGPKVVEHMVDTVLYSRASAATSSASCAR